MKCCEACFKPHANPLAALTSQTSSIGNCDLCGCAGTDVWDASELLDQFSALLAHYEEDRDSPTTVATALQLDWDIFSPKAEPLIGPFLHNVFAGEHPPVAIEEFARLRRDDDVADDHVNAWDRFANDLMFGNRFFPDAADHLQYFRQIVSSRVRAVEQGVAFYRARVCDARSGFDAGRMSMPPAALATPGRANPAGIPHLYLARDLETCIRECRAVQHNFVTALEFRTVERISVLNLDGFQPLNPFAIEESAASRLDAARTVERLGQELQRPVRPTDNQVEYVPTQYLSGLVRSLGLDGILYASSLHPNGTNVVLFSDAKVAAAGDPETFEIVSMTLERAPV